MPSSCGETFYPSCRGPSSMFGEGFSLNWVQMCSDASSAALTWTVVGMPVPAAGGGASKRATLFADDFVVGGRESGMSVLVGRGGGAVGGLRRLCRGLLDRGRLLGGLALLGLRLQRGGKVGVEIGRAHV